MRPTNTSAASPAGGAESVPEIRNVLVLMCDHWRHDAFGALGNPLAHTPNLDRLLGQSVRFADAFNQAPVCSPTRHSLATGRYVHAHGVLNNHVRNYPGMYTIAHHLAPRGWRALQFGHMHWYDASVDSGYEPDESRAEYRAALPPELLRRVEWEDNSITRRTTGGPGPRDATQHWGHYVAADSIARMEEAVRAGQPFLNWTSFTEPHPPFYPPKELYQLTDQARLALPALPPDDAPPPHPSVALKQREWAHLTDIEVRQVIAGYWGMVALADAYCGRVLDAVERLGIRDETAIIFTADHGEQLWEHRLFTKFVMREASVRVPLLVSLPGRAAGARAEFAEHVDVFPTICELLGVETPAPVQGRSLVPLLGGAPAPADWRDAVFSQIGDHVMVRTADWKLNVYGGEPGELYDLRRDPCEFVNLISDPACAGRVAVFMERLRTWEINNQPR